MPRILKFPSPSSSDSSYSSSSESSYDYPHHEPMEDFHQDAFLTWGHNRCPSHSFSCLAELQGIEHYEPNFTLSRSYSEPSGYTGISSFPPILDRQPPHYLDDCLSAGAWAHMPPQSPNPWTTYPYSRSPPARKTSLNECRVCQRPFSKKTDVTRHENTVHRDQLSMAEKVPALYYCEESDCKRREKGFTRKDNYQDHCRRVHGLGNRPRSRDEGREMASVSVCE